ncbi:hypothetical protein K1719_025340 [Acacia pycnantha]|nr:hypothetical protein K1719_025340 [Acacia pycnantha]
MPRPEGKKVWLSIRYEKLQCFCYNCGKVGHDNRGCGSERLLSVASPSDPRFGAWITTTVKWMRTVCYQDKQAIWYEGKEKWSWAQGNSELRSRREVRDSTPVSGPCSTGLTVTSGDPSRAVKEHPLAMIPYSGGVMNNVINQLSGLELKRSADEEWESSTLKRRKLMLDEPRKSPDIASYASNLRKAKAKLKRDVKRKKSGDKENIPAEVAEQDADMEVLETAAQKALCSFLRRKGVGGGSVLTKEINGHLQHELSICHEGHLNVVNLKESGELVRQIELAWDKEEAYW